jgi:hypothetical protein
MIFRRSLFGYTLFNAIAAVLIVVAARKLWGASDAVAHLTAIVITLGLIAGYVRWGMLSIVDRLDSLRSHAEQQLRETRDAWRRR